MSAATSRPTLTATGIEPVAVAEVFEKTNPYGRAMLRMASVVAYCNVVDYDIAD